MADMAGWMWHLASDLFVPSPTELMKIRFFSIDTVATPG